MEPIGLIADLEPHRERLAEACARDVFGLTVDKLQAGVDSGRYLAVGTPQFVAVYEQVPGRQGPLLSVTALAGSGMGDWLRDLDRFTVDLARDQGCAEVMAWGRRGWERELGRLGYTNRLAVMTKEVSP